jgi:catecholate siderophore receptor
VEFGVRGPTGGVIAYAKGRSAAACLVLLAGGLAAPACAEEETEAAEVDAVQVVGRLQPLARDTGLAAALTSVQDTPQQVTVIDAAQLRAQGVTSLEQALRNVPGITVAIGEGGTLNGDQFKIRGFDAKDDVYVDGLRDFGAYTRDSFNYEEVQVLKGPSGAMFGRGTTGGAINTRSKAPRLEDFASVDAYAGGGDYLRALADVNRRVGETSAARLALMATSSGVVGRDLIYSHRWGAALTGAYGLGTDTQITAGYLHQSDMRRPDYGVTIVQRPGEIIARPASEYGVGVERSSFLGYRADVDKSAADLVTVRFGHRVNDKVSLTSDSRYGAYQRYFQYSTLDQCLAACTAALFDGDPATEAFGGNGGGSPYHSDAWGLQNISTVRLDHNLGPLKNQAILGVDLAKQVNDKRFLAYTLPPPFTTRPPIPRPLVSPDPSLPAGYGVFEPVPGVNLSCPASGNCTTNILGGAVFTNVAGSAIVRSRGESTDFGAFLTDRLWLTESLSLIGSLRIDRYRASLDQVLYSGAAGTVRSKSSLKSPRLSAVFEPAGDQTYYLSWGRSETPQGTSVAGAGTALTATAKDLAPEVSGIVEAGAKVGVPGTRLMATASVFHIRKGNALQADPATGFLVAQSGEKQQAKGIELGLTGRLTPAWTLSAGYAYVDAKIRESFVNCAPAPVDATGTPAAVICPAGATSAAPVANTVAIDRPVTFTPRHAASLYSNLDLSAWVEGLSAGGDLVYQGRQAVAYQARSVSFADRATLTLTRVARVPKSVTLDVFVSYRAGPCRFSLNGYNLADRLNYAQVFSNRAVPAAGRTIIASVGAEF